MIAYNFLGRLNQYGIQSLVDLLRLFFRQSEVTILSRNRIHRLFKV